MPQFPDLKNHLEISISKLILLAAAGFTLIYNLAFFRNAYAVYGDTPGGQAFTMSLAVFLFAATTLFLSCMCVRYLTKPVLIVVVFGAASANYYMNTYNIVIDTTMLTNVVSTDSKEVRDLIGFRLILELVLLGLLPAWLILNTRIKCAEFLVEVRQRAKLLAAALVLLILSIVPFSSYYTSFFREHKILRYYANPVTLIYSSGKFIQENLASSQSRVKQQTGLDAHIPATDTSRELIVLVVGEAARADHFSLNGYTRETNPMLAQQNVLSFKDVTSCGTATAYSLPCMFARQSREDFDLDDADSEENLVDVLTHAGVNVLWRDNNSDSKGVAAAIDFQDFQTSELNPVCDDECRDVGMLAGLNDYISAHQQGDIVIVLHQMGNHGPAYYRRYPPEFEKYLPVCRTAELGNCSDEEINNAYDNAILYTDYFLNEVIRFLQGYDADFETAMYYMSDHGESLGENGLYLHGLPWMLAPDNQKHVASIMWFGSAYEVNRAAMEALTVREISHDNYFHTVLGLLEIQSAIYDPEQDLIVHTSPATESPQ